MMTKITRLALVLIAALALTACQPQVSVEQRVSNVGQGLVFEITNQQAEPLQEIRVKVTSPSGEVREHFEPSLGPGEMLSVGWLKLDGWPIPEGSSIEVSAKGFVIPASHP